MVSRLPRLAVAASLLLLGAVPVIAGTPTHLRLATTTSTQDTGLLDYLLPDFEREHGCTVDVIAVGTGQALRLGANGDVDVLLVHDPEKEEAFMREGHGLSRRPVMANDFVIAGPSSDPAGVGATQGHAQGVVAALRAIAAKSAPFVSRGDESGTHGKERSLWSAAGIKPEGSWYRESGQGMGATLQMAGQMQGYVLSDRGTFLAMRERLGLEILSQGDPRLLNLYSVIPVRLEKGSPQQRELAESFVAWLLSAPVQKRIGTFVKDGQVLFKPNAAAAANTGKP